jgi:hypothetical protein
MVTSVPVQLIWQSVLTPIHTPSLDVTIVSPTINIIIEPRSVVNATPLYYNIIVPTVGKVNLMLLPNDPYNINDYYEVSYYRTVGINEANASPYRTEQWKVPNLLKGKVNTTVTFTGNRSIKLPDDCVEPTYVDPQLNYILTQDQARNTYLTIPNLVPDEELPAIDTVFSISYNLPYVHNELIYRGW